MANVLSNMNVAMCHAFTLDEKYMEFGLNSIK
jgi:hypothetical protein